MHISGSDDDFLLLATFYAQMTDFDAVFSHAVRVAGYLDLYKGCEISIDTLFPRPTTSTHALLEAKEHTSSIQAKDIPT